MSEDLGNLVVSSSPHIRTTTTIDSAMRDVVIALLPALILSLYYFKWAAASVIIVSVATAVFSEYLCQKVMKIEITLYDYSAVITGLLLAFTLPPGLPLWIVAIGSASAIIIAKQIFGGLGNNIFNPALVGRAILLASWPVAMTTWKSPIDGVTTATPLAIMKEASFLTTFGDTVGAENLLVQLPTLLNSFIGNIAGSIGETSALALILGGLYLIYKGHVDWRIPGSYIGTVFVLTTIIAFTTGRGIEYPIFHLVSGSLLLGAFFMATDWVSTPITKKGRIIFGLGCGLLTVLIRLKGGYPEGVCYSILLMNCVTPLIDRYTKSRIFGR
ncbi:electron transport complex protein RnfD [Desulfonispora thiosulfatigenes DSM 11270]|uniref:Ion-translocating oxidoreductase complex subunit D n=1 Tax=Desulfonispora thiosulfatigenes DSM 11270 TaxID=656914 RepID=A0A1W1UJ32_DESTI|nr:RnfABCDGE type electron transport complex subunit D [Desulfonispora thiosulfatigenes]SMB81023.1 electron transport complex protein RnfD [Desulfonispora thiosulfatigenes DSM 11270]